MRLRTLLLGSAAAIAFGGAATTANAADPVGLVATAHEHDEYALKCASGAGWVATVSRRDWCITVSGRLVWRTRYGEEYKYNDAPVDLDGGGAQVGAATDELGTGTNLFTGFEISTRTLRVRATTESDAGRITINIPIWVGTGTAGLSSTSNTDGAYITIGDAWRFDAQGFTYTLGFGDWDLGFRIANNSSTGMAWADPDPNTTTASNPVTPDFRVTLTNGPIDLEFHAGQRDFSVPAISPFWSYGFEGDFEFDAGDAFTIVGGVDFDRILRFSLGAPGNAFGANLGVTAEFGDFDIMGRVYFGRNSGEYTGYKFKEHPDGNYWRVSTGVTYDPGEFDVGVTFDWWNGPLADDGVMELKLAVGYDPASMAPVNFDFDVTRTWFSESAVLGPVYRFGFSVGVGY